MRPVTITVVPRDMPTIVSRLHAKNWLSRNLRVIVVSEKVAIEVSIVIMTALRM